MSESEAPKPKPVSPEQKAIDLETGAKESPALSYYLEELAQIPPLKKQERQIIFAKLSTPAAPQARERLFQAYLRIVPPIAVTLAGDLPIMEIVQKGNEILRQAVEKFDPERSQNFHAFGARKLFWDLSSFLEQTRRKTPIIEIPARIYNKVQALASLKEKLNKELGRPPSPKEIAEGLGLDPENPDDIARVKRLLGEAGTIKAIRHPKSWEGLSPLPAENSLDKLVDEDPEIISSQLAEVFKLILTDLPKREVRVIKLRFGLIDGRIWTLEKVGKELGVNRERVRQIEAKALKNLRHPKKSRYLRAFL